MKWIRNIGVALILFSMLVMAAGCVEVNIQSDGQIEYKEYDELVFDSQDQFDLNNFNGAVIVLPAPDDQIKVQYSKVLYGQSKEELAEVAKRLVIKTTEGTHDLKVQVKQPSPRPSRSKVSSMRVDFRIYLPTDTEADLLTRNGEVRVSGLRSKLTAETINGKVQVEDHFGDLKASTKNGKVVIKDVEGSMDLYTANGQVTINGVKGQLKATTANGGMEVDLDSTLYGAHLNTSNGKIEFKGRMIKGYDYELNTSNGRIELWIDQMLGYNLFAANSNGRIRFNFPYTFEGVTEKDTMEGQLFGGGIKLILKNSNGDIEFFQREG